LCVAAKPSEERMMLQRNGDGLFVSCLPGNGPMSPAFSEALLAWICPLNSSR
jgi:hypothetical protein